MPARWRFSSPAFETIRPILKRPYAGKVTYKNEIYKGKQEAIIPEDEFQRVQGILRRNCQNGGALVRNSEGALLKGLLRCVPCNSAMTYTYYTKDGARRYHYYVCSSAQKRGWKTCPSKSVPAFEIERFVVEQIFSIGRDPSLIRETLAASQRLVEKSVAALEAEQRTLEYDRTRWHKELQHLAGKAGGNGITGRSADLQDRIGGTERRMAEVADEIAALRADQLDESEVVAALAGFNPIWEALTSSERIRLIHLLVARVNYDGSSGKVAVTFHPSGFKSLAAIPLQENVACRE